MIYNGIKNHHILKNKSNEKCASFPQWNKQKLLSEDQ